MTLFYNGIEVWGSAIQNKYFDRIDKFFRRAYRYGYTTENVFGYLKLLKREIESYSVKLYLIQDIPGMNCFLSVNKGH